MWGGWVEAKGGSEVTYDNVKNKNKVKKISITATLAFKV